MEVTPPIRHSPAPRRRLPPLRRASSGFSRRDPLASRQREPFKQVPGKRVAAAFVGAPPPARAPRPPLPLPFQLFRGGLLGVNCRLSIFFPDPPAFPPPPALRGWGDCNLAESVYVATLSWQRIADCLPRIKAVVCWDSPPPLASPK